MTRLSRIPLVALVSLGFLAPSSAWALSCDEIMNMQNVNVPTNIIVQTVQSSGTKFTASDIQCLDSKGAAPEILAAVKQMAAAAEEDNSSDEDRPRSASPSKGGDDEGDKSAMDQTESLGDKVPEGDDTSSAGGDDEDSGGGPKQVEELIKLYRAKKVLTASKGLYDLLQDNTFPEEESKINYYLAKSLYDLGMYHGSEYYFMQVVRKGPANPYFKYALPKLVAIAQMSGDDTELLRIVDKIPPESFPRSAKNELYYLMGRKLYEDEKLSESKKYFDMVSTKSDLYLRSRYFEGVIANDQGKLKTAVKAFRDVIQADAPPADEREARELDDLKDLSLMNIARIYYGIKNYDNADNFYQLVSRDSTYWPDSLFERAWTSFMKNDLNGTLGLLLTVKSPYYTDEEFIPEATVLRALTFFQLCEFNDVEKILLGFESDYKPMREEMKSFLDQYSGEENKKLTDQAFDQYFTQKHKDSKLSRALFTTILRNHDLADIVRHLDMLDQEEKLIDAQKGAWKDDVGAHLHKIIDEDRTRYKKRGGAILLQEMAKQYKNLGDLMTQSEVIRFEVVDAQRADYEYKMQNPEIEAKNQKVVDFATSKDIIYWPFNGEFWQDELGYYRYTESSACK